MTRNDRKKLLGRFNEVRNTVASGSHYSLFNIMSDGMKAVVKHKQYETTKQNQIHQLIAGLRYGIGIFGSMLG